ncbi:MAG: DUF4240 domain-containing protein [Bacteroidota bacterium]
MSNKASFWSIINALDWSNEGKDEQVLDPAVQLLSNHTESFILNFFDWFSEQLYKLDGPKYADAFSSGKNFSADLFLYARCAVLANGKDYYERIFAMPNLFPTDLFFEALLNLPFQAYELKMGQPLQQRPKFIYETGFNVSNWGERAVQLFSV